MKRCYEDFLAAGNLPEEFSSDSKKYRRRGNVLDGDMMGNMQFLINQDSSWFIRSMEISAEEHMKVLKKADQP